METLPHPSSFDILVIGGGHAGIEAANAAWKIGAKTAMAVFSKESIGHLSCNPAIGGVGKGQMVRDIDAMGGLMGILADQAGIMFRMLNASKGPAVWGNRIQCDMDLYTALAQKTLENLSGLEIIEGEAVQLEKENELWKTTMQSGEQILSKAVVIASGTFLKSKMFTGLDKSSIGGRINEPSAEQLSLSLQKLGIKTRRLKTETPSRIDAASIDFSKCEAQCGDAEPWAFSSKSDAAYLCNDAKCYLTRTTKETHRILEAAFDKSPLFTGKIQGLGPRYCPSIEDKIKRFADKESHQLFLEPETIDASRIYINGFNSSLPEETQIEAMRTIPGLENARVLQIGYAVEYDAINATELHPTLECKKHPGLYFAGQVCGTSGYEEAAAQGIIAGINAALKIKEKPPFILSRADSYIGVLIDDITTMDWEEPYRMFTSRAEYRLFLRADNSEQRLSEKAYNAGMLTEDEWENYTQEISRIEAAKKFLSENSGTPEQIVPILANSGQAPVAERTKWLSILKRPGIKAEDFFEAACPQIPLTRKEKWHLLSEELYSGFFLRAAEEISNQQKMSKLQIPPNIDYLNLNALSMEARQKLNQAKPLTLGAAAKVAGVRASDIAVLRRIFYITPQ
ncbi:MAG: tRNA uridine-5-carboxymethylaminomethyl(34) synthesis enzyme MnmG [Fibromonadaceae bacterium]|nr:tRNA uridine-5-carboxymethylaminomethyl(34) synthesis enzyme MnmG [Fibromonadaceae bacterium]